MFSGKASHLERRAGVRGGDAALKVRLLADRGDIERLRPLARADHEESAFRDIPFSDRKFDGLADKAASDPKRTGIIAAERDGRIHGFIMCTAGEYFIGEGALLTTVTVFYVRPDIRASLLGGKVALRLIRGVQRWSEHRGVDRILFHVTSGTRVLATDKLFKKTGARLMGGNYMLVRLAGG